MSRHSSLRAECLEANRALPVSGLVDLTFGNVSVCDREAGVIAIKPSGVDYSALRIEDIVILDLEGRIVEGSLRPSSDTPTHRRLYLAFQEIRSVVHTHSRTAVSFAQAAREIPLLGTTHADYFRSAVPVTRAMTAEEIGGDYEWETGNVIVERFRDIPPLSVPAVLVRHHGPFSWGVNADQAVETALALEIVAHMALHTLTLDPCAAGPSLPLSEKHFLRKHGATAYYGQ
ncbi:MAG: L-ribulose-5-phosphate 4-epimerase AraD [Candidatus Methylacidiphilales bacterium]